MTSIDVFSLLTFPSATKGLSAYKPGLNVTTSLDSSVSSSKSSPTSGSDSPPRKSARLEGDLDHSDSAHRRNEKDRDSAAAKSTDGILKLTLVDPPENDMTEVYFDSLLPTIHNHICSILSKPMKGEFSKSSPSSHGSVYQATRTIVLVAKKGQWVYDKLRFELKVAAMKISAHLAGLERKSTVDWLEELVNAATWFEKSTRLLESVLTYLDRTFVTQKSGLQHVRELAMGLFDAHVFQHAQILLKIKEGIKEWAVWEHNERNTHPKRATIMILIDILESYSLFTDCFLTTYIEAIQAYYSDESERLAESLKDAPGEFLVHCDQRIKEEEQRSGEVLMTFEPCWSDIIKATEKSLLEGRLRWLSLGVKTAVDNKDSSGLARMYNLFSRVAGLKMLCDAFKAHVNNKVAEIVKDKERDEEMVDRLLDFKVFIDAALPAAFSEIESSPTPAVASSSTNPSALASTSNLHGVAAPQKRTVNRDFIHAATDAFTTGFRVRRNKPAEMIAKFLDRAMRRGQKGSSDEEFQRILDSVLGLYNYTQDKDVFRTFYHRALAKRLLLQRSASDDFEKAVLKKLQEQFDPEFSMGDHMFRDLALSRDLMREFHEKRIGGGTAEKLNVMVLQRSFWPFSARTKDDIDLPTNMQDDLQKFATFYKNKHQGRKLDFDHSLGTVQMRARFKGGEKELSVSLYQAVVLLLFNDQVEIGFNDLKTTTRMEDGELRRTLQSLACANKKVLKKRPVGKEVNDSDVFCFNDDFTDPKTRVHINSIQVKETPEESEKTQTAIDSDRKHYLDAAIVRIMKAKKTMGHQPLITATIDSVKAHFAPDVRMIKERIEQLIEQEYMRRDEDQENVYVYVA